MAIKWVPQSEPTIDQGGGVRSPNFQPDSADGKRINKSNAFFETTKDHQRVGLWVNAIESDFSLVGTQSQSVGRRQFFPHNFAQPMITIFGQTPNNYEYNRLMKFARYSHIRAITESSNIIVGRGGKLRGPVNFRLLGKGHVGKSHKGTHESISVNGYIPSVSMGAERFKYAHEYAIPFVITRADSFMGLSDAEALIPIMKSIASKIAIGPFENPDLKL